MNSWKVPFTNDQGQEVWERPLIPVGKENYFDDDRGDRHLFTTTAFQHPKLGRLTPGKPIQIDDLPPEPFDPEKQALIVSIDRKLRQIPTEDYHPFVNS
jgi:hypothetical protein